MRWNLGSRRCYVCRGFAASLMGTGHSSPEDRGGLYPHVGFSIRRT